MTNLCKAVHSIVSIWVFDLAVWLPTICFVCAFVVWRCIIALNFTSMIYYATFHAYVAFNLLNTYSYNVNKPRIDAMINRNRLENGNPNINPILLMYFLMLFMGYFNVPCTIFCNQNDPVLRSFTCALVIYLPSILTVLALAIVTPIFENPTDPLFWCLFCLYIYTHFAFIIHNYLTKFNLRAYSLYFNPLTWIYICILSLYIEYLYQGDGVIRNLFICLFGCHLEAEDGSVVSEITLKQPIGYDSYLILGFNVIRAKDTKDELCLSMLGR